ncbi:MAG: AAA family ATPase [Candidatus Omnitrophota bacterium]
MSQGKGIELESADLRVDHELKEMDFETTSDLSFDRSIVGQERALKAIGFGLNIQSEGFNIYVSGLTGTGKNTITLEEVHKIASQRPRPDDLCYLYNFQHIDEPKALQLKSGLGRQFKNDMEDLIQEMDTKINKIFISEEYERRKQVIINKYEEQKDSIKNEMKNYAENRNFTFQPTLTGLAVMPSHNGEPFTETEIEELPEKNREKIKNIQKEISDKLQEVFYRMDEQDRKCSNEVQELDESVASFAICDLVQKIKDKYKDVPLIQRHLDDIKNHIIDNLEVFQKKDKTLPQIEFLKKNSKQDVLNACRVNLLIDNNDISGAPVIVEHNPNYYNLNGYIEYKMEIGVLKTDFLMIKPGALHLANGGFLVIQAAEILRNFFAWDSLKKVIRYKKVKIENIAEHYGMHVYTTGLKPEPIPVDVKVILIGEPYLYQLLYFFDEEFKKIFKVKADFMTSLPRTDDVIHEYVRFIACKSKQEKMLPFKKNAVSRIITYASRLVSHKQKLTARFQLIADLMREAHYWAQKDGVPSIDTDHIQKAVDERVFRSNMVEESIQQLIDENTLIIEIDQPQIGQINGISIIELGDYAFGRPSRITARTFMGKGDIVNIDREVEMSGKIHSKGVLILSGYLGERFARNKPLALSASICFEQLYEEVEGDSASSAELYCLLSSLADCPLRQDIAVTGSVDQRGVIQPVGGINEKIEGFFEVCEKKGLTGRQGVIIPEANVRHLMINDKVVRAVGDGKFHVFPVKTVTEGLQILTGRDTGELKTDGTYSAGSIFYDIDTKLTRYAELARIYSGSE